jgi:hypothetical protein
MAVPLPGWWKLSRFENCRNANAMPAHEGSFD